MSSNEDPFEEGIESQRERESYFLKSVWKDQAKLFGKVSQVVHIERFFSELERTAFQ